MFSYPIPADEQHRLQVLDSLALDVAAPLEEVQLLAELASRIAGTPIALVSLVGADDQIFIANIGLPDVSGTSREVAFCAHAIMDRHQLVVPDALVDARFCNNPMVTAGPGIRAYVGSVLEPEPGANVGTLCVIDTRPRSFSAEVLKQLDHLSRAIAALLRGHRDCLTLQARLRVEALQQNVLRDLAHRDQLTGLLNQAGFRQGVDAFLQQAAQGATLAVIDVDHFKQVNDRWGHPFGDRYLKLIADGLQTGLGPDAMVGRIGGDEFAVLFRSGSHEQHLMALDRARLTIVSGVMELGKSDLGKLSIGLCAVETSRAQTFEALYQRADVALYASKDRGRNVTSVFSQELDQRYNIRVLRARFSEALEQGRIEAFFQPKVHLHNAQIFGFELLARWHDGHRGLVSPAEFEPLFTDPFVASELTRNMIGAAIKAQCALRVQGCAAVRMAVNVTHFDLSNPLFIEETEWRLAKSDLDWTCLELEVTENAILDLSGPEVCKSMATIRGRGGLIALDDFGTGHAGLVHLRDWPIDVLKLDKAFVRDIVENDRDEAIVRSMVALAQRLDMRVIAEGVERIEVAEKLYAMGCTEGQGFLYSPAVEWHEAIEMLKSPERFSAAVTGFRNAAGHGATG
jgi:diguanylate cyclase (GGDEF)-like protein